MISVKLLLKVNHIEFSSRKGNLTQNLDSVGYRILMKKTQNIICCTNGRRIQDIQQLIHDFNTGPAAGKYIFNIWLDEADKFIKSISDTFIPLASEFDNFHCYCMTVPLIACLKSSRDCNASSRNS